MARKKTIALQLRAPLNQTEADHFNELKEKFGVEANSEAMRIIIKNEYERIFGSGSPKGAPE